MEDSQITALVVDDDPIARKAVMFALRQEGFVCDFSEDGETALAKLAARRFDLVVTDLRMPKKHGHALAVSLLEREPRPIIVVHTAVNDPRLAKDLMVRGVDDIIFKPTEYSAFAAKIAGLVRRGRRVTQSEMEVLTQAISGQLQADETIRGESAVANDRLGDDRHPVAEVPLADIEAKITLVSRVLPISTAAFEVYEMTHLSDASVEQVADAIQRDASLAAQVLSIANSSFYNPSGEAIYELERAVVRIGQQRIAELALAAGALSAVTAAKIPWLNIAALWRQSVAAGVAAELLIKRGGHEGVGKSLLLVATMNSLGRVVLATLYPDLYRKMIRRCKLHGKSLREEEGAIFPENHARIMSRLLSAWNVPEEIHEPLKYTLDSYSSLASLGKPLRTKVEIAKTAVFIGRMAAQSWQPWDLVEIPPLWHLKRLKIDDLSEILQQARPAEAADSSDTGPKDSGLSQGDDSRKNLRLYYHNTGSPAFDSVAELIQPMGIQIVPVEIEDVPPTGKLLVNALFTDSGESARQFRTHGGGETAVLAPTDVSWQPAKSAHVLHEPFSYSALQSLCQRLSTAATEPQPVGA